MGNVRHDLIASLLARAWVALLGLLAIPYYVRFLGIEAYGLVGFFTTIQTLCIFLDLGLGATLTRELARAGVQPELRSSSRDVARTFEFAYLCIAILIGLGLFLLAPALAQHWIKLETLGTEEVGRALTLGGLSLACQWPFGLYNAGMAGLHRQIQLGVSTTLLTSFRVALSLAALWVSPTLQSFFAAQLVGSLIQSLALRSLFWRALALPGHRPAVRRAILRSSLGFAGSMTGITITVLLLTQVDKLILSHTLPLDDFGVYVLASTLAMGLYVAISPMQSVMFPRFSALIQQGDERQLSALYHVSAQVLSLLIIPAALTVALFSREALLAWTGDAVLAERGSVVLALLVLGNACNGVIAIPYALQLASAWASLPLKINLAALFLFTPATYVLATSYGAVGGATTWLALNLGYVALTPQLMHRRLLKSEKSNWYLKDLLPVTAVSVAVIIPLWLVGHGQDSRVAAGCLVLAAWALAFLMSSMTLAVVRERVGRLFRTQVSAQ